MILAVTCQREESDDPSECIQSVYYNTNTINFQVKFISSVRSKKLHLALFMIQKSTGSSS